MSDLLKSADFGVSFHLTNSDNFNKLYTPSHFYTVSRDDILQKISSFSSELDERDFELAIAKPLFPKGFAIKPDAPSVQTTQNTKLTTQNTQNNNFLQKPRLTHAVSDNITAQNDDTELHKKIVHSQMLAQQAPDLPNLLLAIQNFQSDLESQKFSACTLAYHDSNMIDILWINDFVSSDDDKNQQIMSDSAGKMVVNLFDTLGYGRNTPKQNGQIGCTALSFWTVHEKKDTSDAPEYQICLPFVKRLIYLLNPKKIILSGDMSLKYLVQKEDVLTHHGQKFDLLIDDKTFACYASFDLSYILRSEVIKKYFWFDLLKILHDNTQN